MTGDLGATATDMAGRPGRGGTLWHLIVFVVDGKPNHVALQIPGVGLADLSLRGARIIEPDDASLPKGLQIAVPLMVADADAAMAFLSQPGLLDRRILEQEKGQRGWHLTEPAPDFVRSLRQCRSRDTEEMNCVEWIARALELGGVPVPQDVLTPSELLAWANAST